MDIARQEERGTLREAKLYGGDATFKSSAEAKSKRLRLRREPDRRRNGNETGNEEGGEGQSEKQRNSRTERLARAQW